MSPFRPAHAGINMEELYGRAVNFHKCALRRYRYSQLSEMWGFCHRNIEREKERGEKAAKDVKTKAKAMAVALQTIGKFTVKKKVGENDKIFGR